MADFGTDLSCTDDLDDTLAMVSGRTLLAQAVVRRLTCPRGQLIDDPNYGIDVRDWMNEGVSERELRQKGGQVDAELLKDERIFSSSTSVAFRAGFLTLTISLQDGEGPFELVLQVSQVTVDILQAA